MEKKIMKNDKLITLVLIGLFMFLTLSTAQSASAVPYTPKDRPVVLVDLAHTTYDSDYAKIQNVLPTWGFDTKVWTSGNWTASTFSGVDIMLVPALANNLTNAEMTAAKNWFDTGNKGIWVAGDSDFGSNPLWALRANSLLSEIGSSIFVESGAVESDINFKATYRVSATVYNTQDPNAKFVMSQLPHTGDNAMASFHGPTAVIAKNTTGYFDLENNKFSNVEWVVRATNATFLPNTSPADADGAQVHTNNQEGDFTVMALQYKAGVAGTSKIVVSGEAPFSMYKHMFDDPGENAIPQNDVYIVYNTLMWFNMQGYLNYSATLPMVMIDYAHAAFNSNYDKFADHLLSWGYNVTKFDSGNFTGTTFDGVDVLIIPASNYNYTNTELTAVKNWFDLGQKAIWVAGDSDFGSNPNWALRGNQILSEIGSQLRLESGAVESDINFKATYRVSAPVYNFNGTNSWDLVNGLPYQGADAMASFHGPTAVIAKNTTSYYNLENNQFTNVEWVVKATNATFLPNTSPADADGAQVHTNNQEGDFVMMALETNAGAGSTSKVVVSGENIFSTYKNMFNDPGENDIPQNDYYIVYNTMQWFVAREANVRPVVMIEASGTSFVSDYTKTASTLQEWGYQTILNTEALTASSLTGVDIVYMSQRTDNYTSTELGYLKTWFDSGMKNLWVTGDSDFGSNANYSIAANSALDAVGSSIYVESGAVESDINFKATYRVSATDYNTTGLNSKYITGRLPLTGADAMASFHGPTAVIGKNATGDYVDLETHYLTNVEWVVKATNGTFLPNTSPAEALGAQVHTNNQEGKFVLMALQTNAGVSATSKIVVTGESIARAYKNMFEPVGENEIQHNDYFIVYNTFQWFKSIHLRPVNPVVHLLTPENNFKTSGTVDLTWSVPAFHAPRYNFEVYVNGSVVATTVGNTASLNLTTGAHEIFVKEESMQGFVGNSLTVTVFVDVDKPVVTITSPSNNAAFTTGSVSVTWTATDVGQGVASYEVVVDGTSKTNITTLTTLSYSATGLTVGSHTITVKAVDAVGNVGEASVTVVIKAPVSSTTTKSASPSPGFELVLLVATLPILYIFKKNKKN
jgi:hypothetical protein